MQSSIDVSSFLTKGQQYTFSFLPAGAVSIVYRPSLDDVTAVLQGVAGIDALAVAVQPASFFSVSGDQFNVTFTYAGDGSDTVASMQGSLLDQLNTLATSFSFVAAYGSAAGAPADTSGVTENLQAAADALKNSVGSILPSTGWIWGIAVILVLALFVYSGGATAVRRAVA